MSQDYFLVNPRDAGFGVKTAWQFLTLQHLALPTLSQLITSPVFLLQLSAELCCKLDLLYWFKVYSHFLLLSFRGLFLTQTWLTVQLHRVVPAGAGQWGGQAHTS